MENLKRVKETVSIPVAMKLSPYFSSLANMAKRLDEAGADGLVLFNRFYQPDIHLETLTAEPSIILSTSIDALAPNPAAFERANYMRALNEYRVTISELW